MKRRIQIGVSSKRERPDFIDCMGRLLRRNPLSGRQRRWRILQKLATDSEHQKS
jgi:hypothetical protein